MGDRAGQMCGKPHIQHRCFSHLDDACRADFGDEAERPRWAELLRYGVAIFDLYYDAIPAAMYALSVSAEGDCYLCVPPDPGIEAAALGACESALPVIAPGDALHTFTLYSGASRYFFRDITTLTHLSAPVPVRLADPSGGPVLACSSTVFPCSAVLSGSLSGLHLPSFSMNLVSTAALQDGHYHHSWGSACVDLHVYTDGSSPCHVHSSASVESVHTGYRASSVSYVCPGVRVRSGSTPLLVSPPDAPDSPGAPPPWSPLPATPSWHALPPPCLWSSQVFASPPALAFPALPSLRRGVAARRSSLLLVSPDDCSPTNSPHGLRLHLREQFHQDLPDRGGEFSSDLLRDFCRGKGILPSFMLQDSPQKNGISERRIGLVMEVARTSMIHAAAPHFLWPFVVRYAAHQLNLHVSLPETSPTLRWTGEVGDASVFRGPAPSGVSQVDPLPGTAPVKVAVGSGAARGAASGGSAYGGVEPGVAESQGAGSGGAEPGGEERGGAEPVGVEPEGAEPEGVEPGGAESEGAESGGVVPQGAASSGGPAGASPRLSAQHLREWLVRRAHLRSGATGDGGARDAGAGGAGVTAGAGGPGGTSAGGSGGARTRGTGASGTGGVGGAGAGDPTEPGAAGARGARGAGARGPVPPQGDAPSGVSQVDPHLGTVPVEVAVDSSAARGAASGGAASGGVEPRGAKSEGAGSRGAEPRDAEPACAEPAGVEPGGAEPEGVEPRGAEPEGVEPGGAESEGVESGGVEPRGTASSGGSADSSAGDTGARGVGATRLGGAGVTPGAGDTGGAAAAGPRGARTRGTGAAGTGRVGEARAGDPAELGGAGVRGAGAEGTEAGGAGAGGARAGDTAAVGAGAGGAGAGDTRVVVPGAGGVEAGGAVSGDTGAGGTVRPQPYFVPLLQQPASPLPAPSPYTGQTGGLTEHRKFESRPVRAVRTGRRVPRPRPPPVPSTHTMALRPSSVPLRVPLLPPPASSLLAIPDPESDLARAASPTVSCLLATFVTDPSFESSAAFSLVAEMVDFVAACGLDNATALVPESESASPPSVGGECALGSDVLEDRQEDFECLAAAVPRFASMLHAPEGDPDARDIPTPRSYTEAITVPPGSPPAFKARYIARGFSQRQGVDYFQTFSPTPKMTTLRVLLHVATQRDYKLHSLDFSTAFLQGSLHEEIWLRRPPSFTGSFPTGTPWSLHRPVYGLRQAPREWHNTLRTTLAALGFVPSTADPSLFLRTDTSLPPFYVLVYVDDLVFATADTEALTLVKSELQKRHTCTDLGELRSYLGLQITQDRARRTITLTQSHMVHQFLQRFDFQYSSPQLTPLSTSHSLSAPPSDESVEPSGPYPELVGCLMYLMTCTRPDLAYPLSLLARYVAPDRHRKVHWDAAKRFLRYLCSTSGMGLVLGGRGPVVLTGHADASWVDDSATQRSSQGYTFSLGSGSVSWRSTRSSSFLSSSYEAEIYARAMAAQELRWLTYLLTDLGEQPCLPPVLYVDNKAMIALYQEHRLEHRTKHIALRYFLARELQQRGQLRLAYVATRANTADVFTKALPPGDHQRFVTVLGLVPTLPHLFTA
ncbi:unnamed protein product [Closterium sp. NIES-54]